MLRVDWIGVKLPITNNFDSGRVFVDKVFKFNNCGSRGEPMHKEHSRVAVCASKAKCACLLLAIDYSCQWGYGAMGPDVFKPSDYSVIKHSRHTCFQHV